MNKLLFCLIIILCKFQTNLYGINFVNGQYVPPDYIVITDEITAQVIKTLTQRHKIKLFGVTQGLANCVNELGLSFEILRPQTKESLRKILIDCMEEYLHSVNSNEKIRPFLKKYPFTANEINITIFVVDQKHLEAPYPEIAVAETFMEKVFYRTVDKKICGYKSTDTESYEEALKIVKDEQEANQSALKPKN